MKLTITILLLLILSFAAFGQKKTNPKPPKQKGLRTIILPEKFSSVYDIRNFKHYYILTVSPDDQLSVNAISKVLETEPSIQLTKNSNDAQFFVRYWEQGGITEMRVYYLKPKEVVIVWAQESKKKNAEIELAEEFLKVLQRNKKIDVPIDPGDASVPLRFNFPAIVYGENAPAFKIRLHKKFNKLEINQIAGRV